MSTRQIRNASAFSSLTFLVLIAVRVPISSSGRLASAPRVSGCTFQVGTRRVIRPASWAPICTVLLVCWPVLASISGSITSSRGPLPRVAWASWRRRSPARATASAKGAATSGGGAAGAVDAGRAGAGSDDGAGAGASAGGAAQPATRNASSATP